jgi:hypothetical protein
MKILIAISLLLLTACAPNYSDGSRVGVVNKLSHKGLIFKSWEGEMVMGGMRQQSNTDSDGNTSSSMVANVFAFNVDPDMVDQVQAAQRSGRPVELVYHQWLLHPLTIENSHVIIEVKEPPR